MKNIFVIDPSIMIHKIIELTFKDNQEYKLRFFSNYPFYVDDNENAEYIFITIDLSGVEIEEAISELKKRYRCPVIAMVPKFLDYNRDAIVNAGADAILEKPFTSDELRNALASLSESTALKEEAIAEIDSETFEDIGSFDEDLTLSEEDLMDVDREILEQDVSGEEFIIDDDVVEEDEIDTKEISDQEKQSDLDEIGFDEADLEKELEEELGEEFEAEIEEELKDMGVSSIEKEADKITGYEEERDFEIDEEINEVPTQRISPEDVAEFREMAEEIEDIPEEEPIKDEIPEQETTLELDSVNETEEELLSEDKAGEFEDEFEEELGEETDFEHATKTEEVKVEDAFEGDAGEPEFVEHQEVKEDSFAPQDKHPTEHDESDMIEREKEHLFQDEAVKEADLQKEETSHIKDEKEIISEEQFVFEQKHPTEHDESDMIEAEKKVLFHGESPLKEVREGRSFQTVVEDAVSHEVASKTLKLSDEDIKRVADEVVKKLSDRIIREIAWEVIPQIAEDIVLRRIKELEKEIE